MSAEQEQACSATDTGAETLTKSIVKVHFPARNMTLSYYNDQFDLRPGDLVYVTGKLEGLRGCVTEVAHAFKIKLADYQRVIGKADTRVNGSFLMAGSHFVALTQEALPYEQALSWYKAPRKPEDEYMEGRDDRELFPLDDFSALHISQETAERGLEYYRQNRVRYLCVAGTRGRAIVEGTRAYEVEFTYAQGKVGNLVCDCYNSGACKHIFAALLQLRETLRFLKESGCAQEDGGYFAAVDKAALFAFAMEGKEAGELSMECR